MYNFYDPLYIRPHPTSLTSDYISTILYVVAASATVRQYSIHKSIRRETKPATRPKSPWLILLAAPWKASADVDAGPFALVAPVAVGLAEVPFLPVGNGGMIAPAGRL